MSLIQISVQRFQSPQNLMLRIETLNDETRKYQIGT